MTGQTAGEKKPDGQMTEELVKQIALNHFHAYYVRHDMEDMLAYVSEKVQWIGSRDFYVAHNREEFQNLLAKELKKIPYECIMKAIEVTAVLMAPDCYDVTGELELRLPYCANVYYTNLRFSMIIRRQENSFSIVSIHTSTTGESVLLEDLDKVEQRLQKFATDVKESDNYDTVTGLLHLDAFKKKVEEYLRETDSGLSYAMLCTDISNFERMNNLYGFQKADRLLADTAVLLTSCSEEIKLCCRSVADHFVVLVSFKDRISLKRMLEALCDEFAEQLGRTYAEAYIQLGLGVYVISNLQESVGTMVEYANVARKSLRLKKKSRIAIYDAKVYTQMQRVGKIERSMEEALSNREFKPYLQPKYNLETGRIVGAEALVRWIRPDGTMVYPDEFIPIFENNGFIVNIDYYILSEVCRMLQRRVQAKKPCVPISINQSRVLLQEKDYVDKVAGILSHYNTPPRYIELELTERIFRDDLTELADMMGRLRTLGVRWSIDDFGTGYSSLNLLKELPVDIIKIDKSFLEETESSETSKIIIRKTVELTQELDKLVVCEGVETENQADYLRGIRCDVAQGYLYAKPMSMENFEKLIDKEMSR